MKGVTIWQDQTVGTASRVHTLPEQEVISLISPFYSQLPFCLRIRQVKNKKTLLISIVVYKNEANE